MLDIRTVGDLRQALAVVEADTELTIHVDIMESKVMVTIDPGMITDIIIDEEPARVSIMVGDWKSNG